MKRKFLSCLLALAIAAGITSLPAMASGSGYGYKLLYSNTFDEGAGGSGSLAGIASYQSDDFTILAQSAGSWNTATFDGNKGVCTNSGAWPSGRNICFDFTKDDTQEAVTSGIYKVSWDFSPSVSGGGDTCWIGMNVPEGVQYEGGRLIRTTRSNGNIVMEFCGNAGSWGNNANLMTLDASEKYSVEYVMNMDTARAYAYLDGKYCGEVALQSSMSNFTINMCGFWDYFDNLKLEKWDELPDFSVAAGEITTNGAELVATAPIKDWSELAEDVKITRTFDGAELEAEIVPVTSEKALIKAKGGFMNGFNYEITLPETAEGMLGDVFTFASNKINADFAKTNAVKSIKLRKYNGELVNIEETNVAEIKSVVVEFTDDVNVESAMKNVVVRGNNGVASTTAKAEGNIGEAVFDNILEENATYNVQVYGMAISYAISFKTQAGIPSVRAVKLYESNGEEEITTVLKGDKVVVKIEIANPTGTEVSYLGSVTMNNGRLMTGVDFEAVSVAAKDVTVSEFEFTVSDTSELSFNGFMWCTDKTAPMSESVVLSLK